MPIFMPTVLSPIAENTGNITRPWKQSLDALAKDINNISISITTQSLNIQELGGTADFMGRAVLIGGTKVISNTNVTATSNILLTNNIPGGTPGFIYISARTPGVSFTILSSNGADTSTIAWLIINPA